MCFKKAWLPNALTISRIVLALAITLIFLLDLARVPLILTLVVITAATDLLDGWLARRLRVASAAGAKLDSLADYVFYGSTPLWIFWSVSPALWDAIILPMAIMAAITFLTVMAKLAAQKRRFLHLWSAKLAAFGVFAAAFMTLAGLGQAWMIWVSSMLIVLADLEELAILAGINKVGA
jgi:phosphatidylglycerophosphate synthase